MKKTNPNEFEYVIELENLTRSYGFGDTEFKALNDISLKIKPGEFVVIMGPSGCGKTTLLNVLGLIDESSEGNYCLEGREVNNLSSRQKAKIRNKRIGFIFQNFNLIPRLSVIENVALPLMYAGKGRLRRLEKASKILSSFQLSEREYYMPWQISGGQIQRVAIARALVNDPAIILADEPTGNLDSKANHIIMEELYRLNQAGNTIVMVTHNPNLTSYADRVITMLDGKIISDKDNNSGEEMLEDAPEIQVIEEEADPKVSEIIIAPNNPVASSKAKPEEDNSDETNGDVVIDSATETEENLAEEDQIDDTNEEVIESTTKTTGTDDEPSKIEPKAKTKKEKIKEKAKNDSI